MRVVVRTVYEVYDSCKPSLLFYRLICFQSPPLAGYTRITTGLLQSLSYQNSQYLEYALKILSSCNFGLVSQYAPGYFTSYCASCMVCLCMQKRDVIGEGKCSKERNICFDGSEEEIKDVRLCRRRVQIGAIDKLCDFLICIREDLIDIFCLCISVGFSTSLRSTYQVSPGRYS